MKHARHILFLTTMALASGCFTAVLAQEAETDADFSKYCRETFPGSAPVMRAVGGQMTHYCNRGGTLQGIDLAQACLATTGSLSYRLIGARVICRAGTAVAATKQDRPLQAGDFVRYCRETFANSTYQNVPGANGNRPHCRRPGAAGGVTLQPVDLQRACDMLRGGGTYRLVTGQVHCGVPAGATSANGPVSTGNDAQTPAKESNDSDPAADDSSDGGTEVGTKRPDAPAAGLAGDWRVRVGTLRGATIQVEVDANRVVGRISKVPASLDSYFRTWTALEIGDVVFVGRQANGRLTGRSILGITGLRTPSPDPIACGAAIASYRADRNKWPRLEAVAGPDTVDGRHGGVNLYYRGGRCEPHGFIDHPPLVKDGWVGFVLERVR